MQVLARDELHEDVGGGLEAAKFVDMHDVGVAKVHAQLRLVHEHTLHILSDGKKLHGIKLIFNCKYDVFATITMQS